MTSLAFNPIPSIPWRLLPFVILLSGCVTGGASKPSFVLAQFDLAPAGRRKRRNRSGVPDRRRPETRACGRL